MLAKYDEQRQTTTDGGPTAGKQISMLDIRGRGNDTSRPVCASERKYAETVRWSENDSVFEETT